MSRYTARQLKEWDSDCETAHGWLPARPINHRYETWRMRIRNAWHILTGKYDVLDWEYDHDQ